MISSVHDNLLVSYEVHCEKRTITLRTEHRAEKKATEFTNVLFEGVHGYHFENDAFGNIIFDVADVSADEFLKENGGGISELRRMTGQPAWAEDLRAAPQYMSEHGITAFVLSSSLGLSGWILAKKMSIFPVSTLS
ncbi:MAG TPA: hypothetical protein VKR59_15480 [Terriglobales bacterium]|nr:hypothetical protein [Terriglobales bacterium]